MTSVEIRAEVPSQVQSVDLDLLSELAGCTTEELIDGLHDKTALDIAGAVVTSQQQRDHYGEEKDASTFVAFETHQTQIDDTRNGDEPHMTCISEGKDGDEEDGALSTPPMQVTTTRSTFVAKPPIDQDKNDQGEFCDTLILGIPATTTEHHDNTPDSNYQDDNQVQTIHVADGQTSGVSNERFSGFLLSVDHVNSPAASREHHDEQRPLLNGTADGDNHAGLDIAAPVALSFPVNTGKEDDETSAANAVKDDEDDNMSLSTVLSYIKPGHTTTSTAAAAAVEEEHNDAYLIQMSDANDPDVHRVFLAVPEFDDFKPLERQDSLLERTLSLALPSDVTGVAVKTVGSDCNVQMVVERKTPVVGYALLLLALLAISSGGAALDMQTGAPALMKLYWRMSATSLSMFPLALLSLARDGPPKLGRKDWGMMFVCSMCYVVFFGAFLISLEYTTIGDAFLFANSHSLILVLGKMAMGLAVAFMEGSGAFIGLMGGVLCTFDAPEPMGTDGAVELHPMTGNLYAIFSAFGGVGYLLLSKKYRPRVDLFVFMFFLLGVGSLAVLCLLTAAKVPFSFSRDPAVGLFGWTDFQSNRLPLQLYLISVCDLIGTTGYVAVMKYFDPLVVSVVMLLEPVVATGMGLLVGVGGIPGEFTIVGGSFVTLGTLMVIVSSSNKTETYNIKTALKTLRKTSQKIKRNLSYGALFKANGKDEKEREGKMV